MIRWPVPVSGQVRGVLSGGTCQRMALAHGVGGWVRNLPDGRVEAIW
jgi:acylphosphatase